MDALVLGGFFKTHHHRFCISCRSALFDRNTGRLSQRWNLWVVCLLWGAKSRNLRLFNKLLRASLFILQMDWLGLVSRLKHLELLHVLSMILLICMLLIDKDNSCRLFLRIGVHQIRCRPVVDIIHIKSTTRVSEVINKGCRSIVAMMLFFVTLEQFHC